MKVKRLFVLVMLIALTMILGACAQEQENSTDVKITLATQEYEGDNIVEIPYFEYNGEWIEIRTYPFTDEQYLQVVVTHCIMINLRNKAMANVEGVI